MPLLRSPRTPLIPAPDPRLSPEQVVRRLTPFLSASRRQRIERVLARRLISLTVVLEDLYDPHNGAAVLRSCEGLGLFHVHIVESEQAFFFAHKVSQNSHKWLNVYLYPTVEECLETLHAWGFRCWGAVPPDRRQGLTGNPGPPLTETGPLALVFGNEHKGLSRRALELCESRFSIPMYGFSESFNLSVSAAVTLSQLVEARRTQLGGRREIEGEALARLRAGYYALSSQHSAALLLGQLAR